MGLYDGGFKDMYSNMLGEDAAVKYKPFVMAAAGASAEIVADVALCPWEMIKVKMQLSPTGTFPTAFGAAWAARSQIRGFPYGSLGPLWSRQIPYTIAKFVCFEKMVDFSYANIWTEPRESYGKATQLTVTAFSGYSAGVVCALVSQAPDNLVSQMAKAENNGKTFSQIAQEVGARNLFFSGLGPRIFMIGTLTAAQWFIFDAWKTANGLGTTGGK